MYTASRIVTDTYYRLETTGEEKALLYYCSEDYAQFALEDWQWKLWNEIERLRESLEQDQKNESRSKNEEATHDMHISRVRRHYDLVRESMSNVMALVVVD